MAAAAQLRLTADHAGNLLAGRRACGGPAGRAIPDGWRFADPAAIVGCRLTSAADALRHHLDRPAIASLAEPSVLLWKGWLAPVRGRPLTSAWSQVPRPRDTVASAWLAATIVRERRGDGHVLAAVAAGPRGLDAT